MATVVIRDCARGVTLNEREQSEEIPADWLWMLNNFDFKDERYHRAVQEWPSKIPIYPNLNNRRARRRFVQYIFQKDETPDIKNRPGFCCRHYSRDMLKYSASLMQKTSAGTVAPPNNRLLIPIFFVSRYQATKNGHAFNAVYLGEHKDDQLEFENYLFVSPQTRSIIQIGADDELPTKSVLIVSVPTIANGVEYFEVRARWFCFRSGAAIPISQGASCFLLHYFESHENAETESYCRTFDAAAVSEGLAVLKKFGLENERKAKNET